MEPHWLVRPSSVRLMWGLFVVVLAMTVVAGFFVSHAGLDGAEANFAFGAWYGFAACAVLIALAKGLAVFLKRPDTYHDSEAGDD